MKRVAPTITTWRQRFTRRTEWPLWMLLDANELPAIEQVEFCASFVIVRRSLPKAWALT